MLPRPHPLLPGHTAPVAGDSTLLLCSAVPGTYLLYARHPQDAPPAGFLWGRWWPRRLSLQVFFHLHTGGGEQAQQTGCCWEVGGCQGGTRCWALQPGSGCGSSGKQGGPGVRPGAQRKESPQKEVLGETAREPCHCPVPIQKLSREWARKWARARWHWPHPVLQMKGALVEIIQLASLDSDPWVLMVADILKSFPDTGSLNLELEEQNPNVQDILGELREKGMLCGFNSCWEEGNGSFLKSFFLK